MSRATVARVSIGIAVALALVRLLAAAFDVKALTLLDLRALDYRYLVRGPVPAGGEVVIVGIDEQSLAAEGRWPWPRSKIADLVDQLTAAEAAAIGFDVIFDQPDPSVDFAALAKAAAADPRRPVAELLAALQLQAGNDARLAEALRRSGRVVLGHFFEFEEPCPAPFTSAEAARVPELSVREAAGADPKRVPEPCRLHLAIPDLARAAAGAGHINFFPDLDGGYRLVPLAVRLGDRMVPAFALELLRRFLGGAAATLGLDRDGVARLRVGDRELPVDESGRLWLDYVGPPGSFPQISATDMLAGRVPREMLAGKIVVVGFTATGFDEVPTPFARRAPGVTLQATLLDDLLHRRALGRPWWTPGAEAALVVAIGVVLGLLLARIRPLSGAAAALALAAFYLWGSQQLFVVRGLVLGTTPLLGVLFCTLGATVFQSMSEEREKRKIRDAFRHYLNPEVTDLVAREPERLRLGGERREITVCFSDIRGFTSLSEALAPEALGELLNEYLGAMTDIVFRHAGLLDKYIGDAVMAFWGAPVAVEDHAARCCRAALDMLAALAVLHARWRPLGRPLIDIGIGINSGEAVVGNFGSAERFSYTAVGDNVNLASRLEGLNKVYGTRLLVSEATRALIGEEFVCREIDRVRVKGKARPVAIHEVLGRTADDGSGELRRRAEAFRGPLEAYRARAWDDALEALEALAARDPEDTAIGRFLVRCRAMRAERPGEGWDGVFVATSK